MQDIKSKKIRVIGVPLDLGADRRGVDMGPDAMRHDGLLKAIEEIGLVVEDSGDIPMPAKAQQPYPNTRLKHYDEIVGTCRSLDERVNSCLIDGFFPLIIGGDHSITIGTAAALSRHYNKIGMIWIDAHGDFNTEDSTVSGNIHGMSFATAVGLGSEPLVSAMGVPTKVCAANCVLIGARDLDPLERQNLRASEVTVFTMREIDENGIFAIMRKALEIAANGTDAVHVSFDLDSMDPLYAPGVGTPVMGGFTYREAHLMMEMVSECPIFSSLEVVELNPILDRRNETGKLAIGLIASALGKKIL